MFLIAHIILYICMSDNSIAVVVSIAQNVTGFIGNNDTPLMCSFIYETSEQIMNIHIFAKNLTEDFDNIKTPIAIFTPDKPSNLHSSGHYLTGRVTLTNITRTSINATLTFNVLKCEDEKDYMCKCFYKDIDGIYSKTSQSTRISVQATSSKPDRIKSSIVSSSTTTDMQGFSTSSHDNSLITKKGVMLTITTSSIDTMTTTHLQPTDNLPLEYNEEDNVMFTCTGNIGYPPGKLIWQKTFPQEKTPITYPNETTYIEEIPGTCTFKGTSHLTVKIYAGDIKATIRCFEESQANKTDMYLETAPFDVLFQVNHVVINKQPNLKQYDTKTDNITLTCKFQGIGNPHPNYVWFKEGQNNNILSNESDYVIENVIRNNSGLYICEVNNIIDDTNYKKSNSVEIYIDTLPSSPDSALMKKSFIEIAISVTSTVLLIVTCVAIIKYCCSRSKRKNKVESCSRKRSFDGITFSPEYASVILPRNTIAEEKGNTSVGINGDSKSKPKIHFHLTLHPKQDNKNSTADIAEDLIKTVDLIPSLQTTSFHSPEYAVPSDALQTRNETCNIPLGMTSFKDQGKM